MANQRQKAPELLANRRGDRGRKLQIVPKTRKGRAPAGLDPHARLVWKKFWSSKVSSAVDLDAHMERLRHWILSVNERERLRPLLEASPLVNGSHGQLMVNPLQRRIRELTRDIERAEEAYGMTPLSVFRLQLTYADASMSLDDLRKRMLDAPPGDDPEVLDVTDL